jgi:DNA gyrase subunit A
LKKVALTSLRSNPEHKIKDDDYIAQEIETHNKADLLLFSNKHVVYKLKIYEVNDCKASSLGDYLNNSLGMEPDEKIIYMVATDDYKGTMLFSYENGKSAKIELESYATKTNRKKLANAYSDASRLIHIMHLNEDIELVAISNINKVLIFNTDNINPKSSRNSQGVQVLLSKKGSTLECIKKITEVNFEDLEYYRTKNIPAKGRYLKTEDKEGKVVQIELGI